MRRLDRVSIVVSILGVGMALGALNAMPTDAELNESAQSLCYELGGDWRTDWCDIELPE